MRRWMVVVLVASFFPWAVAQTAPNSAPAAASSVRITSGPTVEYADDSRAVVSWTTNLPATSTVHFGKDPRNLDHVAAGATAQTQHRVNVADLSPSTKYYFVAESQDASGGGVPARSVTESVTTVAAGQPAIQNQKPVSATAAPASVTNAPTTTTTSAQSSSTTSPEARTMPPRNVPAPAGPAATTSASSPSSSANTPPAAGQRIPESPASEAPADGVGE